MLVGDGDVIEEGAFVLIALYGLVAGLATYAGDEVEHGGRGDGQLGGIAVRNPDEPAVVLEEGMVGAKVDPAGEAQLGALGLGALELDGPPFGIDVLHALERLQEVQMPHGTAELAIGHGLEAGLLLLLDEIGNRLVLHGRQLDAVDPPGSKVLARLLEASGTQEAADDVVGVGRLLESGHGGSCRVGLCRGKAIMTRPRGRGYDEIPMVCYSQRR